jgi:hypothetical protein
MIKLPSNTIELIVALEELYPDTMVIDEISEFERLKLAGKVELIRYLKHLAQLKPVLEDK